MRTNWIQFTVILLTITILGFSCAEKTAAPAENGSEERTGGNNTPNSSLHRNDTKTIIFKGSIINFPVVPNEYYFGLEAIDNDEINQMLIPYRPSSIEALKEQNAYLIIFDEDPGLGALEIIVEKIPQLFYVKPRLEY